MAKGSGTWEQAGIPGFNKMSPIKTMANTNRDLEQEQRVQRSWGDCAHQGGSVATVVVEGQAGQDSLADRCTVK